MTTIEIQELSDDALLAETRRVADVERRSMADLLVLLIEVERRHLCATLGYSSLFAYCTRALGLSEQAAYSRITVARAVTRVPAMLPMLADGALTLSSVGLLAPHLTDENQDALLSAARHQSTRAVEKLLACASPQPDIPSSVRALPSASDARLGTAGNTATPTPAPTPTPARSTLAPLSSSRYLLKVTISQAANDDLERARDLLRHVVPNGDPAVLVERALALLVREAERVKIAATRRPRHAVVDAATTTSTTPAAPSASQMATAPPTPTAANRHIPAAIKRAVWARDGGRCAFVGTEGRCHETGFVEFHHVAPFAAGGATDADNLQLRCHSHNTHEARLFFGAEFSAGDDAGT